MTEVAVTDAPEQSRFEARIDGRLAGWAEYDRHDSDSGGVIVFTHTEVGDDFEGQGVGSALARTALDRSREAGLAVVPRCEFIHGWIDKHPDYQDLVKQDQ